jgi:hypothetical protein
MGKKMTKAGMELRHAIRADADANPSIDHKELRSKHGVAEGIVESALTKTVAEWDALISITPGDVPAAPRAKPAPTAPAKNGGDATAAITTAIMPGMEQGIIKFTRKPAKMGTDYIFWIPRVYVKNGLVDPRAEYEVYLKKKAPQ